jgi:organic radical activating enzyme
MKFEAEVQAGTMVPLMEEFYTIQGEGYHTGKAAYFIRIGGCDVGCHWCDVKESWNAALHPPTAVERIAHNAAAYSKTVVVTGGEPLTWNMKPLTDALKAQDIQIHIETSGAYPLSGHWDWICLSPKKTMPPRPEFYAVADELKVIVFNRHDLQWAEEHAANVKAGCALFLQPEWSKREEMLPIITDYVMKNPKWRIGLQSHKYIGIP